MEVVRLIMDIKIIKLIIINIIEQIRTIQPITEAIKKLQGGRI
jgi:hypothetical protein